MVVDRGIPGHTSAHDGEMVVVVSRKAWMSAAAVVVALGAGSTAAFAATGAHSAPADHGVHVGFAGGMQAAGTSAPTGSQGWKGWHGGKGWQSGKGWHGGRGMFGAGLSALAKDLNLTRAQLRSDLKAGQSIATIAKAQGVATATLISDLETAAQTKLATLVSAGKLTNAQEQTMLTRIDQRITNFVNGTMPKWGQAGANGWHGGRGMFGAGLSALAKDLNLSTAQLRSDLKAGQSIATIAKAQGVATATLISDLETAAQTKLAALVSAGKLTSAQEQTMLTRIDQGITNFVNGTMPNWHKRG